MALTLRVTSFHSQALGSQATKVFGTQGGTIGRKNDNDWVLPDPERFISSQHASIVCRNGTFYICDLSVNGTFINGGAQPIGSGVERPLNNGDSLQIGDYDISVSVDAGEAASPGGLDAGGADPFQGGPPQADPGQPLGGFPGQGAGQPSAADPLDFFGSEPAAPPPAPGAESDHASSLDQFYQPPPVEQPPPAAPAPPAGGGQGGGQGGAIPENWDMTDFVPTGASAHSEANPPGFGPQPPASPPAQPAPPPSAQPAPPPPPEPPQPQVAAVAPTSGDAVGAVAAILQNAGMDPASARAAASSPALVQALGMLLGIVVQGMLEVLKARTEIKTQFRVPVTMMRSVENNPLKFSASAAQALQTLLQEQNQAYLGPVDAFAEGFQDIKAHQMAMMAGMRAAFDSMIQRFDPDELVKRFEKRLKHGALLALPGKGRYWDMYKDLYEDWTQDADRNFQSLFGDEFARAYEEQMRRLTAPPR